MSSTTLNEFLPGIAIGSTAARTAGLARMHVDGVIPGAVVRDPAHGRRQTVDERLVEDADALRGLVLPVDPDSILVLPAWAELREEARAIRGVNVLRASAAMLQDRTKLGAYYHFGDIP